MRCLLPEAKNSCFFSAACTKLHRPVSSSLTSYTVRAVADCSPPHHDGYKSEENRSSALFSFHIRQTQTANKPSFIPPSIQTSSSASHSYRALIHAISTQRLHTASTLSASVSGTRIRTIHKLLIKDNESSNISEHASTYV